MELPYYRYSEPAEYAMKMLKSKAYKATHRNFGRWLESSGLKITTREFCWIKRHKMKAGREHRPVVYFFICKDLEAVKIGTTTNVEQRLLTVQTGCPFQVEILGWCLGAEEHERVIHSILRRSRLNGEWFRLDENVKDVITEATDGRVRFDD